MIGDDELGNRVDGGEAMEALSRGTKFRDRYAIEGVLGRGGFAIVYLARDVLTERTVALKILEPARGIDDVSVARFRREAKVLAALTSPHTVRLFEYGEAEEGRHFMVFQHIDGRSLAEEMVARPTLPEADVRHILAQLLDALREAHLAGVLHRDIKPSNVMLRRHHDDPNFATLIDFGVAKLLDPQASDARLTATDTSIGTVRYMAPEQLFGDTLTPATDLYALGLVAYELLTGRRALESGSPQEVAGEHARGFVPTFPAPSPISPGMRRFVEKMTRPRPAERYASADDALQDLEAMSTVVPVQKRRAKRPSPLAGSMDGRARLLAAGAAILAAGLLLGLVLLLAVDDEPSPPRVQETLARTPIRPKPSGRERSMREPPDEVAESATMDASRPDIGLSRDLGGIDAGDYREHLERAPDPSAGCGKLHLTNEAAWGRIPVIDGELTSRLSSQPPTDYDVNHPYPLVFVIPERSRSHSDTMRDSGLFDLGAQKEWLVAGIRRREKFEEPLPVEEEVKLTVAGIERMLEVSCVDRNRIWVVGVSTGGHVAQWIPCVYPLAGLAMVSWRTIDEALTCPNRHPTPTITFNGKSDPRLPLQASSNPCGIGGNFPSETSHVQMLREVNRCEGEPRRTSHREGECDAHHCAAAPLTTCLFSGANAWPHDSRSAALFELVSGCQRPATTFPTMQKATEFFESEGQMISGDSRTEVSR